MAKPTDYRPILGKSTTGRFDRVVLEIAGEQFSRYEMASKLVCAASTVASHRLTEVLKVVGATTEKAVKTLNVEALLKLRGVGFVTIYVLLCWLEFKGVDVEKWYGFEVTAATVQHRVRKKKR